MEVERVYVVQSIGIRGAVPELSDEVPESAGWRKKGKGAESWS